VIEPRVLPPGATLGVLGGGQLGRMFVGRAREMGYRTYVFDPDALAPAGTAADRFMHAPWSDRAALAEFAAACDAVTLEFENVPADVLEFIADYSIVAPAASAVRVAQDRLLEKQMFYALGIPTAEFAPVCAHADIPGAIARTGLPAILKTARLGYDGKGQASIASQADCEAAFRLFGEVDCILEQRLALHKECSVILARSADGSVESFEPGENVHHGGILHTTLVPARIPNETTFEAIRLAERIADALKYVGVMGVEFFVTDDKRLYINEIAPRPHNSGHWTRNGDTICQFEQQLRALCGLPLGQPRLLVPVCMINILGDVWPEEGEPDWSAALALPNVCLHLYGKAEARPGRKMGHINVISCESEDEALAIAESAWLLLQRREPPPLNP